MDLALPVASNRERCRQGAFHQSVTTVAFAHLCARLNSEQDRAVNLLRDFSLGGRTRKAASREIDLSPFSYHGTTVLHGQLGDLTLPSPRTANVAAKEPFINP
jgi:hypothetical protein